MKEDVQKSCEDEKPMDSSLGWKVRYEREQKLTTELEKIVLLLLNHITYLHGNLSQLELQTSVLVHSLKTGKPEPSIG